MIYKLIIALLGILLLTSCATTYYMYYEVDSPEEATGISMQDGIWARNHKSPSRVITAYPDSTGKTIYLMETMAKEKITNIDEN